MPEINADKKLIDDYHLFTNDSEFLEQLEALKHSLPEHSISSGIPHTVTMAMPVEVMPSENYFSVLLEKET